ncbi:hypothetical protein [Streptomyces bugieae]|uniref:Uncharacterized protein n=1 Tax=Streptomyces bugieae TaxID=3098223 RepID=A0ABU7NI34_9ACTN|nr:hypothetical protein [Streptomyces sp. DSM 41528]
MPRDIFGALGALVRAEASRTVPKPKTTPPATSRPPGRPVPPPGVPAPPPGGPADPPPGAPDAADTADAPVARGRRRPLTALLRTLRLRRKGRPGSANGRSGSAS